MSSLELGKRPQTLSESGHLDPHRRKGIAAEPRRAQGVELVDEENRDALRVRRWADSRIDGERGQDVVGQPAEGEGIHLHDVVGDRFEV
jgi:hypothetical protein